MRELVEEYAAASVLDPRRATLIAQSILDEARDSGLLDGAGIGADTPMDEALTRLDAHLCDLGETSFRDGLHVFGRAPDEAPAPVAASAVAERAGLLAALDGRFVEPGPSGSPSRGRADVLPTGRNLATLDPRAIPSRAAALLGTKAAEAVVTRYLQDEGTYPARIVMDLWASPTLRTGGEDVAHALALMGVRPVWDHASTRVTGFEVLPLAMLDRPRIDVTVRVSGAFRDTFPDTLALIDRAARAVADRDEAEDENPLAAARRRGETGARVYGAAPGRYGAGTAATALDGSWDTRADLGRAYLAASTHAYGDREGPDADFAARVAAADAYLHAFDAAERDLFDGDAAVDAMGGFAAAAALQEARPALYSLDVSVPERPKARTAREDAGRLIGARLADPRWIAAQLRHGYRGAQELAQGLDAVFVLAAASDVGPMPASTGSTRPGSPTRRCSSACAPPTPRRPGPSWSASTRPATVGSGTAGAMPCRPTRCCRRPPRERACASPRPPRGAQPTRLVPRSRPPDAHGRRAAGTGSSAPGVLSLDQARAVAQGARLHGNGHLDITARANLQIRGVSEASRAPLAGLLTDAGLGDRRADGGPQRLTLTQPLAGQDPAELIDVPALAHAIEVAGRDIPGLPAKTLIVVEGRPDAAVPEADCLVTAGDAAQVAIVIAAGDGVQTVTECSVVEAPALVTALFAAFARTGRRRMRDLSEDERARLLCSIASAADKPNPRSEAPTRPPSPLCGGVWPLRRQGSGEGSDGAGEFAPGMNERVSSGSRVPPSRDFVPTRLPSGPPCPAEGGGRCAGRHLPPRQACMVAEALTSLPWMPPSAAAPRTPSIASHPPPPPSARTRSACRHRAGSCCSPRPARRRPRHWRSSPRTSSSRPTILDAASMPARAHRAAPPARRRRWPMRRASPRSSGRWRHRATRHTSPAAPRAAHAPAPPT